MKRSLQVTNVITTAKAITELDPPARIRAEKTFWTDFDNAKLSDEPSGECFLSLMSLYLQASKDVHDPLTRSGRCAT